MIGVIILNYLAYHYTINCVNYFLEQQQVSPIHIVIVDNGSENESFQILSETFKNNPIIDVISTQKNLGFAQGNNFGYAFLKERFTNIEFVVVSNDDIELLDTGLFIWINKKFSCSKFAVLGPDIYSTRGGFHQSPQKRISYSPRSFKRIIFKERIQLLKLYIKSVLRVKIEKVNKWENPYYDSETSECILHGAFLVFSKLYLDVFENLFDPFTFLYYEENILRLRVEQKELVMLYSPTYRVNHLQSVSNTYINKTDYKKMITREKNIIKSMKRYMNLLKKR